LVNVRQKSNIYELIHESNNVSKEQSISKLAINKLARSVLLGFLEHLYLGFIAVISCIVYPINYSRELVLTSRQSIFGDHFPHTHDLGVL